MLLDKAKGLSSNHAMLAVRRLLGAAKAGHGGTLDPMASGLLPVLLGEATKFAQDCLDSNKTYLASLRLCETSSTGDAEGQIVSSGAAIPERAQILAVLHSFVGPIQQIPPMHSALKQGGQPLYRLARSGVTIEREARPVTIGQLDLIDLDGRDLKIRVQCSKGTYIRVLAEDVGRALGCGAWLADLRREAAGALALGRESVTLAQLESMDPVERRRFILPIEHMLGSLMRFELDEIQTRRFLNGQKLRLLPRTPEPPSASECGEGRRRVCVYGRRHPPPVPMAFLGLASLDDGVIVPLRLISTQDPEEDHSR
jgi:tRNA pseudouridine55 synthase